MFDRSASASIVVLTIVLSTVAFAQESPVSVRGTILDDASGKPIPARLYILSKDGMWHFAESAGEGGTAVRYDKARSETSVERHTSLSAHPFEARLPAPGEYTLTVERGKEWLPAVRTIIIRKEGEPLEVELKLRRWIDMNALGWYSGETHVHRTLDELPTAMLAEHLNVALPLTYWVTRSGVPPSKGDKSATPVKPELIEVDKSHVIYPLNTEYEIFTVDGKRHALGAVFVLNHKTVLEHPAPPVTPIARQARREGALLELDKHNWPWSMMLVPVMDVDLFELSNNHVWRTNFHFGRFYDDYAPEFMHVDKDDGGMTENGWLNFTFQNYYTLLNCGFRMRPTAGTASGVHPVPLGLRAGLRPPWR